VVDEPADGGLELPPKVVQARFKMTFDISGHLFPSADATAKLAAVEKAFLAV
jgi:hypothetical protein